MLVIEHGIPYCHQAPDSYSGCTIRAFYYWKHLPSGTTGQTLIFLLHSSDLQSLIELWNQRDPTRWVYADDVSKLLG